MPRTNTSKASGLSGTSGAVSSATSTPLASATGRHHAGRGFGLGAVRGQPAGAPGAIIATLILMFHPAANVYIRATRQTRADRNRA
jgi:hypothetical protein